MRREKKSSGRNLLSRTSASKLANFPCIVWLSMHLWHWKPLGQESNSKIHNRKIQRNCSFLLDFISLLERIFLLHDVSQQLSFEHEEFSSRDTSLYSYYWIVPSWLTYLFTSFGTLSTSVHYKWMGTYTYSLNSMRKKYAKSLGSSYLVNLLNVWTLPLGTLSVACSYILKTLITPLKHRCYTTASWRLGNFCI